MAIRLLLTTSTNSVWLPSRNPVLPPPFSAPVWDVVFCPCLSDELKCNVRNKMITLSGISFCSLKARLCRGVWAFEWSCNIMTQFLTSTSGIRPRIFEESPGKSFRPGRRGGPSGFRVMPFCFFLRSWKTSSRGLEGEAALETLSEDDDVLVAASEVGVSGSCCASERRLRLLRAASATFLGFLDGWELLLPIP